MSLRLSGRKAPLYFFSLKTRNVSRVLRKSYAIVTLLSKVLVLALCTHLVNAVEYPMGQIGVKMFWEVSNACHQMLELLQEHGWTRMVLTLEGHLFYIGLLTNFSLAFSVVE